MKVKTKPREEEVETDITRRGNNAQEKIGDSGGGVGEVKNSQSIVSKREIQMAQRSIPGDPVLYSADV